MRFWTSQADIPRKWKWSLVIRLATFYFGRERKSYWKGKLLSFKQQNKTELWSAFDTEKKKRRNYGGYLECICVERKMPLVSVSQNKNLTVIFNAHRWMRFFSEKWEEWVSFYCSTYREEFIVLNFLEPPPHFCWFFRGPFHWLEQIAMRKKPREHGVIIFVHSWHFTNVILGRAAETEQPMWVIVVAYRFSHLVLKSVPVVLMPLPVCHENRPKFLQHLCSRWFYVRAVEIVCERWQMFWLADTAKMFVCAE